MSTIKVNKFEGAIFDGGVGEEKGRVGIVVLATDQTLEHDISLVLLPLEIGCHFTRIQMDDQVTPESLKSMTPRIGEAVKLLLPNKRVHVLAYACTSASATIGEKEIFEQLSFRETNAHMTTPLTAALKAFEALQTTKIGLVTPYIGAVNNILIDYIQQHGYLVTNLSSFDLIHDSDVASVSCNSIIKAAKEIGMNEDVDLVFISCTSLRTKDVCKKVEQMINKPVLSSNMVLAWHMLRLVGCSDDLSKRYGSLFGKML